MSASKSAKLSNSEIAVGLSKVPGWENRGGKFHRAYKFADFVATFGFITGTALIAQDLDPLEK